MAKKKSTSQARENGSVKLPAAEGDAPEVGLPVLRGSNPTPPAEGTEKKYVERTVVIELPIGPLGGGYRPRHVDVQLRTAAQRGALRQVLSGLDHAGDRTADKRRVTNNAEAVRWLLEQIAEQIEEGIPDDG